MTIDTIDDLIHRLEAATGPDRRIDVDIWEWLDVPMPDDGWPPRYTGSIDVALTLVPDGYRTLHAGESINGRWFWGLHMDAGHPDNPTTRDDGCSYAAQFHSDPPLEPVADNARSAALAICIASLRARAADNKNRPAPRGTGDQR